jgi:hypothetical protein
MRPQPNGPTIGAVAATAGDAGAAVVDAARQSARRWAAGRPSSGSLIPRTMAPSRSRAVEELAMWSVWAATSSPRGRRPRPLPGSTWLATVPTGRSSKSSRPARAEAKASTTASPSTARSGCEYRKEADQGRPLRSKAPGAGRAPYQPGHKLRRSSPWGVSSSSANPSRTQGGSRCVQVGREWGLSFMSWKGGRFLTRSIRSRRTEPRAAAE